MLRAIFLILLLQLAGEAVQQFFQLAVPGPVIGLIMLLLGLLLLQRRTSHPVAHFREQLVTTAEGLLAHLSLLFVPIGVGVIMHLQLLESQLVKVLGVIVIGTLATLVFTAFLFQALRRGRGHE